MSWAKFTPSLVRTNSKSFLAIVLRASSVGSERCAFEFNSWWRSSWAQSYCIVPSRELVKFSPCIILRWALESLR